MVCRGCGRDIKPEASFCPFCGKPARPSSGQKAPARPSSGQRAPAPEKRPRTGLVLAIAALLLIALALVLVWRRPWKQSGGPAEDPAPAAQIGEPLEAQIMEEPTQDAGEYFERNAQIRSTWSALDSETVKTEAEAVAFLEDRGFSDRTPQTEYSIEGEYSAAAEVSADSEEKHPIYQTQYVSSGGEIWTVFLIDESIVAYPVFYNVQLHSDTQLIIAQSGEIISYDSRENVFYQSVPNPDALIVKVVDRIDAETLDRLTAEEIDQL